MIYHLKASAMVVIKFVLCIWASFGCRLISAAEQTWHRSTFVHEEDTRKLNHLIMVPGHGVTIKESLDGVDSKDESWFLLKYQRSKDVPKALVGHIRGGLDELDADDDALLLFSGERLLACMLMTMPVLCEGWVESFQCRPLHSPSS